MGTLALINLPDFLGWLKEENPGWKTSVAPRRQQQFKVEAYGNLKEKCFPCCRRGARSAGWSRRSAPWTGRTGSDGDTEGWQGGDGQAGRGQAGRERGCPPHGPSRLPPHPRGVGRGAGLARRLSLLHAFIASAALYFP